jgi:hypothetical protein
MIFHYQKHTVLNYLYKQPQQIQINQQRQIFKGQNTYQLQIIKRFVQLQTGVKVKQLFKKHQRQVIVKRQIL